ncbi:MAG: T9SS type A sorting domain-containing protein [Bacteroidetes bacterium]|nr:T9SS type A sorting domain-containing protein [Bacteroidota bacterium]
MRKVFGLLALLIFASVFVYAQEELRYLSCNPALKKLGSVEKSDRSELVHVPFVYLPFIDDFTSEEMFPDQNLWCDRDAFINNTGAKNPFSFGVATLDAIDETGNLHSNASTAPFIADYLTSVYARLDSTGGGTPQALSPADSVYFSFYYQPQGYGNPPEAGDSLVLEFTCQDPDTTFIAANTTYYISDSTYSEIDSTYHYVYDSIVVLADTIVFEHWRRIWSSIGMSYQEFVAANGVDFKYVMVPISDAAYFRKHFRFRFCNYASIAPSTHNGWASNVDQWHIDYIYLDFARNSNDIRQEDVFFVEAPRSLLNFYSSMPWTHYKVSPAAETVSSLSLPYFNNSDITKNVKREFYIEDISGNGPTYTYAGGNLNINTEEQITFSPPVTPFSSNGQDSALFSVKAVINTSPDINRNNDTAWYFQRFYNFYAYDDDSPEVGYGIYTQNAKFACEYNSRKIDTLRAIDIYFNQTLNYTGAQMYFKLMVWSSIDPEVVLYEHSGLRPIYDDSLNQFYRYRIEDEVLLIGGKFFIGWYQYNADFLNVGFDLNTNNQTKNFYRIPGGNWTNSMYQGSVMIRPVFGKYIPWQAGAEDIPLAGNRVRIAPNPFNDRITIFSDLQNSMEYSVSVIDLSGRVIYQGENNRTVDLSGVDQGIYFVRIIFSDGHAESHKVVKSAR